MTPTASRLTLVVRNPEHLLHGCTANHEFNTAGGSIGSGACDWVLNDRQHAIQPLHCEIRLVEGRFCVIDRCGLTRLNGHDLPMGRNATVRLNDGDCLHVGAYSLNVFLQHDPSAIDSMAYQHLSQHAITALFNQSRCPLETLLDEYQPTPQPDVLTQEHSPDFERLGTPLGSHEQHDPLRALDAIPTTPATTALTLATFENVRRPDLSCRLAAGGTPMTQQPVSAGTSPARYPAVVARTLTLILACLLLGGCTMLGKIGHVIMNPSSPVGEPEDRPTQIALSLYATHTVNPNAGSVRDNLATGNQVDSVALAATGYTVNLSANNPLDLTEKLEALLDHLYTQSPAYSAETPSADAPAMSPLERSVLGDYTDPQVSLTEPGHRASTAPTPEDIATPIAFKIVQLKDDSLLRNANLEGLTQDLQKALGSTYIDADDYVLLPGQFKFIDYQPIDEKTRYLAVIARYHETSGTQWKQILRIDPKGRQYALLAHFDSTHIEFKDETP